MSRHSADFLNGHHHSRPKSQVFRYTRAALVTAGVLILLVAPFAYSAASLISNAYNGRQHLETAISDAQELNFSGAVDYAGYAHDSFLGARDRLAPFRLFGFIPALAPSIEAIDGLLTTGIAATDAASEVFAVADGVLLALLETRGEGPSGLEIPNQSVLFKDLTSDEKRRMLSALAADAARLKEASARLDAAAAALDGLPTEGVAAELTAVVAPLREQVATARTALGAVAPIADVLPTLLGYPDARHYLFFFQNNDELRPTGGFLGVFGALTVKDAGIVDLRTDDVYALDGPSEKVARPAPPEPIRKYIGVEKWYLRDANWSPDFPTAAKTMQQFYREEASVATGVATIPQVDGIIAITPDFAEDIVRLTGPVTVGGQEFGASNLIETLQYEVEMGFAQKGVPYDARKDIVGALVSEVTAKLMALPVASLIDAVGIVRRNLDEGHIVAYSDDDALQAAIDAHDWGGRVKPVTGDYVSYIDANLAALKTDSVIERSLKYSIVPSGDGFEGRIAMTYHNAGTFTWKTTRYRTYARVFLPGGTGFLGVEGAMVNDKIKDPRRLPGSADGYDQLGRKAYGAFISVEPGETRTLEFRISLAPQVVADIKAGAYHLDVEKQLGTEAVPLTLDLDFGKKLTNATPPEASADWGDARYRLSTDLRVDRVFDLKY